MDKRIKIAWSTAIILSASICAKGQNLIPNPGFEAFEYCPEAPTPDGEMVPLTHWFSVNLGTPDLFSACSDSSPVGIPNNASGHAESIEGKSYAGLYSTAPFHEWGEPYVEVLSVRLKKPLNRNSFYRLTFHYYPATRSRHITNKLSVAFSADSLALEHSNRPDGLDYLTVDLQKDILTIEKNWRKVELIFQGRGYERYFLVGDLMPGAERYFLERKGESDNLEFPMYYLYDAFTLEEIQSNLPTLVLNQSFSLEKLFFDHNEHAVREDARSQLYFLAQHLKQHSDLILNIYGNTDKSGSEDYNLTLSMRRAAAVKRILQAYGVDQERLKTYGFGETRQIRGTASENRRVEFVLEK